MNDMILFVIHDSDKMSVDTLFKTVVLHNTADFGTICFGISLYIFKRISFFRFIHFHQAPYVKFIANVMFYVILLLLYAFVLLTQMTIEVSDRG